MEKKKKRISYNLHKSDFNRKSVVSLHQFDGLKKVRSAIKNIFHKLILQKW